jgi:dTDP-4-amino-4,6-dideoxygalactose transaminase
MLINTEIQHFFSERFHLNNCVIAGRANVILYSIFKTLPQGAKVVFPAIMCPSPLFVALSCGVIPILCDVDVKTGLISEASLNKCLKHNGAVSAVLSVNLYGQRPNNQQIYGLCKKQNILLIEDACQGWSPNTIGKDVDVVVMSFGSKKPFDSNGGGLGITNDRGLFDKICANIQRIVFTNNDKIKSIGYLYHQMYYMLQNWEKVTKGAQKNFVSFHESLEELYFKDMKGVDPELILASLLNFKENLHFRFVFAKKYEEFFADSSIFECFMKLETGVGPWRYGVLFKGQNRDFFMSTLREKNIDVSSWYPSLDKLGFDNGGLSLENAHQFGEQILNFWVSDISKETFSESLDLIKKFKE